MVSHTAHLSPRHGPLTNSPTSLTHPPRVHAYARALSKPAYPSVSCVYSPSLARVGGPLISHYSNHWLFPCLLSSVSISSAPLGYIHTHTAPARSPCSGSGSKDTATPSPFNRHICPFLFSLAAPGAVSAPGRSALVLPPPLHLSGPAHRSTVSRPNQNQLPA